MRRKIQLYIGGQRADITDQSFILFNYALTDLEKPTAVKNSFSKQVTLPGTAANDVIFGHFSEPSRQTAFTGDGVGIGFNAGKKTPFVIFDELGQVLESGYCRLDSVARKERGPCSYKVTLFGGIGSFFYNLSYTGEGEKKTLANLPFPYSLDFTINADTLRSAWNRLATRTPNTSPASKWDIINFAPAYNGKPSGDFDAKRGVVTAATVGLPGYVSEGEEGYETKDGKVLVQLANDQDEWACKDIRSYLQRPAISMRAVLEAIAADADDNGGFVFDYSAVPSSLYDKLWKTLPDMASLGTMLQIHGEAEIVQTSQQMSDGEPVAIYDVDGDIPLGADATLNLTVGVRWKADTAIAQAIQNTWTSGLVSGRNLAIYFFQLVAYNGNTVVGSSPVKTICAKTDWEASSLADAVGYHPVGNASYEAIQVASISHDSTHFYFVEDFDFAVTAQAPTEYRLLCRTFFVTTQYNGSGEEIRTGAQYNRELDFFAINANGNNPGIGEIVADYYEGMSQFEYILTYASPASMRSGAWITKDLLLSSKYTPAEYLISFAKHFGLMFLCNSAEKVVRLVPRNSFFQGEVVDLTNRVQRIKDVTITPQLRAAKWYVFSPAMAEGAFAKEYAATYGVQYGAQKVDTGYDFDAADIPMLDGNAFQAAVASLDHSIYWNRIFVDNGFRPSPFVDKGNQYTLWSVLDGKAKSYPVPCPPSTAVVTYYNTDNVGYDLPSMPKLQLKDDKGAAVDGADVLVYFTGFGTYPYFKITDDSAAMVACNDGKPCWDLEPGSAAGVSLPCFTRYPSFTPGTPVTRALDFGMPREVDIPRFSLGDAASLYVRYWRAYLADRLNTDTKVLKCWIDLSGLQVGQDLLRKFYYYQGAYWMLNKITNYSLTTWDPTECELVQVQDMSNYTNGQNL